MTRIVATSRIVPGPIVCLIVVLSLLLCAAGASAEKMTCAYCKKPIDSGKWFKVGGKTYHYNHFKCANCGQPIGEQIYVEHEGRYYDSTCYVQQFSKRCAYCNEPMMEWVTVNGVNYHDSCYTDHVADRCAICGKPILGNYLYDSYGAKIHPEHKGEAKQCDYCSRFVTSESDGGVTYPDGRTLCGLCLQSVVASQEEADSLLLVARNLLAAEGIVINQKEFDMELVSREKMRSLPTQSDKERAGFTHIKQSTYLYGLFKDNETKIYILEKMPRMHFIATAAHELMHVWFGLKDRFQTEDILAEGSCNYASYLVMLHFPGASDDVVSHMLAEDDPIYGEGFRKVKEYAESVGTIAWLQYIEQYDFPPWIER